MSRMEDKAKVLVQRYEQTGDVASLVLDSCKYCRSVGAFNGGNAIVFLQHLENMLPGRVNHEI